MRARMALLSIVLLAMVMIGGAVVERVEERASIDRFSIGDEGN